MVPDSDRECTQLGSPAKQQAYWFQVGGLQRWHSVDSGYSPDRFGIQDPQSSDMDFKTVCAFNPAGSVFPMKQTSYKVT